LSRQNKSYQPSSQLLLKKAKYHSQESKEGDLASSWIPKSRNGNNQDKPF